MTLNLAPLRRGALIALTLALALAACGGASDTPVERVTATVTNGVVEITSDALTFDAVTIQAPAGEGFTVHLVNAESQPHNFSVYVEEGGEAIVEGDIVTGPNATVDIQVPALEAGEYFFVCDVHATVEAMTGTLIVQ